MAWLALDRALPHRRHPADAGSTTQTLGDGSERAVADDIATRGFDPERNTYTRSYGSADLDAARCSCSRSLGLEPADSPRTGGTIDAISRDLRAGGPLLYRYPPGTDGLPGSEGAFLPCSFWLVQALAATGRITEATETFDELVALASPVGLFAEEMDPDHPPLLGNYPQALTHATPRAGRPRHPRRIGRRACLNHRAVGLARRT